jgi:hypothetical protein
VPDIVTYKQTRTRRRRYGHGIQNNEAEPGGKAHTNNNDEAKKGQQSLSRKFGSI